MFQPQLIVDFAHQSSMDSSMLLALPPSFAPDPDCTGVELVKYQKLRKPSKDNHYTFSAADGKQLMQEISQNFTKVLSWIFELFQPLSMMSWLRASVHFSVFFGSSNK